MKARRKEEGKRKKGSKEGKKEGKEIKSKGKISVIYS